MARYASLMELLSGHLWLAGDRAEARHGDLDVEAAVEGRVGDVRRETGWASGC
jgi:hypothetical protein